MGNIRLLDKNIINKIAAGEVVDRPFSVVKELVENSIDSGATQITCEIKEGGKSYIRITDNGAGFEKDDIKTAFLRHSTSKIREEDDLYHIKSLGFRGEALSSISAVSKLELLTKTRDDFLGNRYVIEGGNETAFEEAGCPDGTTIIVRELFYNTPARRKFLKSTMTEAGYINDCINRLAVSHPEISFRFINQGKTILFTNGNGSEKDALYLIYGRDVVSNLLKISYKSELFEVEGYIGKPVTLRGNRVCENYYINGRYSKAPVITKSIEEAYKGYAMNHKYPFTSLHFTFPMEKLDVNVHPSKMEVRITDGDYYYAKIFQLVNDALHGANLIVDTVLDEEKKNAKPDPVLSKIPQSFEVNRMKEFAEQKVFDGRQAYEETKPFEGLKVSDGLKGFDELKTGYEKPANTVDAEAADFDKTVTMPKEDVIATPKEEAIPIPEEKAIPMPEEEAIPTSEEGVSPISKEEVIPTANEETQIPDNTQLRLDIKDEFMNDREARKFTIIGQLFDTYWMIEMEDSLFIIDQHAAHEKILYERTMKKYRENRMYSQQIFPSLIVNLSLSEEDVLKKNLPHFEKLGFAIEHFGGREYAITAVPTDLFDYSGEAFFHDMLDMLSESPLKGEIDYVVSRIATMSCKAAIKGNMHFPKSEAENLIKELLTLDNPYHCPHGRPVIITMTKYELERKFKRII